MNSKSAAVIAVTFPNRKTGKVFIAEYPQCLTLFCRLRQPPQGCVPTLPEIDVEVFVTSKDNSRVIVRGTGSSVYSKQIKKALEGYFRAKQNFVQSC